MRASLLAVSAALGLCAVTPAFAQSPPDTPAAAQTSSPPAKGDEVLDPSRLPKARQGAKEEGNRVDALSPDEQRRLDRIRAKAASKEAAKQAAKGGAKSDAAKSDAAKSDAAKSDAAKSDTARLDAARLDAAKKAAEAAKMAAKAEADKQAAAKQAAAKGAAAKAEATRQDAAKAETARREAAKAEAARQEAAKADAAREAARAEAAKADAGRREAAKAEASKAEAAKTEATRLAAAKAAATKAENRPAPRDAEIKDPMPPRAAEAKAPTAARTAGDQRDDVAPARPHPTRRAARRAHGPDTADLDQGRVRRPRMVAPQWHEGPGPEYAERGPRVGDTVPPGVPLYDLPPRYGAHYPPFPRGPDDDDDYGPPRRFYGEPY